MAVKGDAESCHPPATLGYKQELQRNFTMIEVFGIAFSIMCLLPSIASTLAYSIPAGPVGMVWVLAVLELWHIKIVVDF